MADETGEIAHRAEAAMERSLSHLQADLRRVRTGRAHPALLDGVLVEYYGTPTPLQQVANTSAPEARLLVIAPYDRGQIGAIERAVQSANLGLTPQNDGKVIRIPIPVLTEERRGELVKQVRKIAEGHKTGVREARREALAECKRLEAAGGISVDDRRRQEKQIQELTDRYVRRVGEQVEQKEREILQV